MVSNTADYSALGLTLCTQDGNALGMLLAIALGDALSSS